MLSRLDLHCHWDGPSTKCTSKTCCRSLRVIQRYRLSLVASAQQLEVQAVAAAPVTPVDRAILVQGRLMSTVPAATKLHSSVSPGEGQHGVVIAPRLCCLPPAGFNWESCRDGAWYETVRSKIGQLQQAGATHIWLPPPSQSVSDQVSKSTSSCTACSLYDAVQVHGFNRLLQGRGAANVMSPAAGTRRKTGHWLSAH